jgi:hypothetical protein
MEEPKATSKHTLCGYAWGDVSTSLQRSIGVSDMTRAQRWAAELVCSDLGLGRLEALLFNIWAIHVGSCLPVWCRNWLITVNQLRTLWSKSGSDIKAVRNTPIVRQLVAEAVAHLVLAPKHPLPELPTSADCFREAEAMRTRIRSGNGAQDQIVTRRIWSQQLDGMDLKTIGNELEVAMKSNNIPQTLFWIIWTITLESQNGAPDAKERGPAFLNVKQRKSIIWFLVEFLKEMANDANYLSVEDRGSVFSLLELTWPKLGTKGRRECLSAIALAIQEHIAKKNSLVIGQAQYVPDHKTLQLVLAKLDTLYSGIAEEARKYLLEAPVMAGLTKEAAQKRQPKPKLSATDKLSLAYALINK